MITGHDHLHEKLSLIIRLPYKTLIDHIPIRAIAFTLKRIFTLSTPRHVDDENVENPDARLLSYFLSPPGCSVL